MTRKQFAAAIFTALLSPMLGLLPRGAVLLAGKGAWLSVLPAVLGLLPLLALMNALRRALRPGEGMANLILRVFGPAAGRLVLLLYGTWFLLYAGFVLRAGAGRLTSAVYQESGIGPFLLGMLLLCAIASLGPLWAAARTAMLLRAILLLTLGTVSLFALGNVSLPNLFPLTRSELPGLVRGAVPVLTAGSAAALFSFLNGYTEPPERPWAWALPSLGLFLLTSMLLCFETVGAFGPRLTARLAYPFFTMIRDVSVFRTAQRFEALVIALWVFADFLLCTLLLRCANEALRTVLGLPKADGEPMASLRRGRWLFLPEFAAVYAAARFLAPSASALALWAEKRIPLLLLGSVYGGFGLTWLVGRLRKKV